jgi:hypothetical protein
MNDPESLIQPPEYLKYIYQVHFISQLTSLYHGENAMGYFCAQINSTDISPISGMKP